MSDEKKYTERDVVMRERAAFAKGRCMSQHEMHEEELPCIACNQRARHLYPLPSVTRPRVVRDVTSGMAGGGYEWRVVNGGIQWRPLGDMTWRAPASDGVVHGMYLFPERVRTLADLLANPTETVEDDA